MKSRKEYILIFYDLTPILSRIMLDSENIVENHIINQNNNNQIYCV